MMESFDSEAISSIDLQIEHVFNENWRIYLLRDLESMYSVFCTMASALRKYSIYSCVFYFYSTCRGIICTEIWRELQQWEYCRFWHVCRHVTEYDAAESFHALYMGPRSGDAVSNQLLSPHLCLAKPLFGLQLVNSFPLSHQIMRLW